MKRTVLVILPLLVIVALGYGWGRHWMASQISATPPIEVVPEEACALHRAPCEILLPDGHALSVELSTAPVPLQPFRVQLYASDAPLQAVSVDFQMVDMYMGLNRYSLERQVEGLWSREVMLPVCATGRSDWLMQLRLVVGEHTYGVTLPFEAAAAR